MKGDKFQAQFNFVNKTIRFYQNGKLLAILFENVDHEEIIPFVSIYGGDISFSRQSALYID